MCQPACDVLMVFWTSTSVHGFLQTKQLIILVVFYFAKSKRRLLSLPACYWLRP